MKNGEKNIQAAAYNGACMVLSLTYSYWEMLVYKIGENRILKFVVWSDELNFKNWSSEQRIGATFF